MSAKRFVRCAVVAATVAALAPVVAAGPAAAAPAGATPRVGYLQPAWQHGGPKRLGDFDGNARQDILAREAGTGKLKVYLHSRFYQHTATYNPPETINYGWQGMRWIAPARVSTQRQGDNDYYSDVLAIERGTGRLLWYQHAGAYSGTATLLPPQLIGTGWNINDLVFVIDFDSDGYADIGARRAGTGDTYLYRNTTNGAPTPTFAAPTLLATGGAGDVWQGMTDFTADSYPDLVFAQSNGILGLHDFRAGQTYTLGTGWNTIDRITLSDPDYNSDLDILGRRASDGALLEYHYFPVWEPAPDNTAYGTLSLRGEIGYGWHVNDIIA